MFAQLSPGDLHKTHAHLEGLENCTRCHKKGEKLSADNCLICHTLLKNKIENGSGLHSNEKYRQCETCHIEHQGREFQLVYWKEGIENFNHGETGYNIEGKHKTLECKSCHNQENINNSKELIDKSKNLKRTFFGLEKECLNCHYDEHRDQLSIKCVSCHDQNKWIPASGFDHSKTNYQLTGKHKIIVCGKCHNTIIDNKFVKDKSYVIYKDLKYSNCSNCHKDVHNNKFDNNCSQCHNTSGWKNYTKKYFDHNNTDYPLTGLHKNLRCEQCHLPGQPIKIKLFTMCTHCHSEFHKAEFSKRERKGVCEECHSIRGFTPSTFTIQMHKQSNFPLEGSHLAVPCLACHTKVAKNSQNKSFQFKFVSTNCENCHEDIHEGKTVQFSYQTADSKKESQCELCHSVSAWNEINFNHDKTKLPLRGSHKNVKCTQCHFKGKNNIKSWHFIGVDSQCINCHGDIHFRQFAKNNASTDCSLCHTETDWFAEKFDHEKNIRFRLKGAHKFVACEGCHKSEQKNGIQFIRYKPLDINCESCHSIKN